MLEILLQFFFIVVKYFFLAVVAIAFFSWVMEPPKRRRSGKDILPNVAYHGGDFPFKQKECGCWVDKHGNVAETKTLGEVMKEIESKEPKHVCKNQTCTGTYTKSKTTCCKGKCKKS